jgi:hypothetical protein
LNGSLRAARAGDSGEQRVESRIHVVLKRGDDKNAAQG